MSSPGPGDEDPDLERSIAEPDIPGSLSAVMVEFLSRGSDRRSMRRLLDAFRRHRDWEVDFERSLAGDDKRDDLAAAVAAMIERGADRTELRYRLEAYHLQLMGQGREADDDAVLEVLDFLVGFRGPDRRI